MAIASAPVTVHELPEIAVSEPETNDSPTMVELPEEGVFRR
jgi:hypothetical protein